MDCFPLLEKCLVWISLGNVQICLECGGIFKNDFTTSWYSNESNSLYDTPVACCCVQQAWREGSLPKGCLVYVPLKCAFTLGIRVLIYYVLLHPDESTPQTCSLVELCWSRFVGIRLWQTSIPRCSVGSINPHLVPILLSGSKRTMKIRECQKFRKWRIWIERLGEGSHDVQKDCMMPRRCAEGPRNATSMAHSLRLHVSKAVECATN